MSNLKDKLLVHTDVGDAHVILDPIGIKSTVEYDKTVTRFEVISGEGRLIVRYDVEIAVSYQDDGRTLKVFMRDRAIEAPPVEENCVCGHLLVIHGIVTGKCLACECIVKK